MSNKSITRGFLEDNREIVEKMEGMVSEIRLRALRILELDNDSKNREDDLHAVRYLLKEINHDIPIVEIITQERVSKHAKRVLNDLEKDERSLGNPAKLKMLIAALGDAYGYP